MPDRRFVAIAVFSLLFVVTGVVAVALLSKGTAGPPGSALAIGTFSSLAAAMIVNATRVVVAVRSQPSPNHEFLPGLIRIRPKHTVTTRQWMEILQTAKSEFYIAGHSLGKWCSASNCDEFKGHIKRILDSKKGRVTLVMLDPSSPQVVRLQQATSVDYTGKIHTSLRVLADLYAELHTSARSRLTISVLKDHPALPYMVVGNEQLLVTATYLGSTASDDVACLELKRSSDVASAVYDDFHKLAQAGASPTLPPTTIGTSRIQGRPRRFWRNLFGSYKR